jgi:hypothetical protein
MTNYEPTTPGNRTAVLKTLAEGAAKDIKECANVCDVYAKKTDLAKLILSPVWDTRLLNFTGRFTKWRNDFQSELIVGIHEGVDKANVKLDDMSKKFGYLYFCPRCALTTDNRMDEMKALFQEFVSPRQKQILDSLGDTGGVEGLRKLARNDDDKLKALIKLDRTVTKSPSQAVEDRRIGPAKPRRDETLELDILRKDILEMPDDAIHSNWAMFERKFQTQLDDVRDDVRRESDRIVREVQGSDHERILDEVGFQVLACRLTQPITNLYSLVVN